MSIAELPGGISLETLIIMGGLLLLFVVLAALHLSNLGIRKREAADEARELRALLGRVIRALEERHMKDRRTPLPVKQKPTRRVIERKISAARSAVQCGDGRLVRPRR